MASLSPERPQIFADGGGDYLGPKSVAHLIHREPSGNKSVEQNQLGRPNCKQDIQTGPGGLGGQFTLN